MAVTGDFVKGFQAVGMIPELHNEYPSVRSHLRTLEWTIFSHF